MNCAKMTEPLEMPLGMKIKGPKEPCIRQGPDPPLEGTLLRGFHPIGKHCNDELYNNG